MEPTPALYLREEGTGSPIVLIHGLGGDHTVWNSVIPLLARRHRVLAPDLKGHGQSSAPAGAELTFPQLRTDILDILDRRHIASAHLVGLSAGGFLAIDLAIERPER
ncbi:MAG TPA: alpha/beta fold hydrolase, partial [Thermoplasmata archaeon]|nr:alpha/beta fold hydrolase [Thermoplasmata archaeon]